MKTISKALMLSFVLPLQLVGQQAKEIPRLSGIVHLPGIEEAAFEFSGSPWGPKQAVLRTNGDDWYGVKLVEILPDWRSVRIDVEGNPAPVTLSLGGQSNTSANSVETLVLTNCSLYSLLELYGQFSQRTLMIWPTLTTGIFSLTAAPTNGTQAAAILEQVLEQKQIVTVRDGSKFTMVVPKDRVTSIKPHAPSGAAKPSPDQLAEGGTIFWRGADINQVYFIYAELLDGKMDPAAPRPRVSNDSFFVISQSPLNKEESVYLLETLLAWRGVKLVKGEDGLVKALATSQ